MLRAPLNVLVPPVALLTRRARRRWWTEVDATAGDTRDQPHGRSEIQTLEDGVGDVLTRRYEVSLTGGSLAPQELVDSFRDDPDRFAPTQYASFGSERLAVGATPTVRLAGPWSGPVEVVDEPSGGVRMLTRAGHMEAGWIDFVAIDHPEPVFRIQSTARAGDAGFWFLHDVLPVARWVQTDMWARVVEAAAREAGITPLPRVRVTTWRHDTDGEHRPAAPAD